ncbi:MAG: GspH/FimT family pseudopilin [Acetobacteraceae bacterium]|nr:GspH/FimT family pseudopilin [Acetobacteraceae bacterium]
MVLVILGLMLGVIVMRGPTRSQRLDLDMATRDLAGSLRMARSRAIAQNRPVAMQVGPGSYSLDGEPPHRLAALVMAGSGAIGFAPSGASSGGTIILRAGTREAAIQVDWLTGRVSVTHGR